MYNFDFGGFIVFTLVLVAALAVGLVVIAVMWLTGVRPDWWMLWVLVGMVVMAIASGAVRRLTER